MRTPVYLWPGPPRLEVWIEEVEDAGRTWTQHGVSTSGGTPGAVVIVERGGQLLLVEHNRPVTGRTFLELPRGFAETSDDGALATGARELREETGLEMVEGVVIGRIWPDSGLLSGAVDVLVCTTTSLSGGPVDGEVSAVRWVERAALAGLIRSGEIADGITLAALAVRAAQVA